jgi:hypothetical protein
MVFDITKIHLDLVMPNIPNVLICQNIHCETFQ